MTPNITISDKVSDKFLGAIDIIAGGLLQGFRTGTRPQADFAETLMRDFASPKALQDVSFDCIVRDRFSIKASTNSPVDIFNSLANRSSVSSSGICLWLNQTDQLGGSTFVRRFSSLYDSFKNSSLVSGLSLQVCIGFTKFFRYVITCNNNNAIVSIAQTTKLPSPRELAANQYSRKDGKNRPKLYEQYNRKRGRSPSPPSFTMPYPDVGGTVMQDYLTQIPAGREGYIYLIHAEGTNRYKIGRSVNPIARAADIQKQSPYQLKIIESAWTLDAPFDEAELHKCYAKWKVFGEWFSFGSDISEPHLGGSIYASFYCAPTMEKLGISAIESLTNFLGVENYEAAEYCHIIWRFYPLIKSRAQIAKSSGRKLPSRELRILVEQFVRKILPQLILDRGDLPENVIDGGFFRMNNSSEKKPRKLTPILQEFIAGAKLGGFLQNPARLCALLAFEKIGFDGQVARGGQND